MEALGWTRVGEATDAAQTVTALASENSDVVLSTPSVYFNTVSGRYEASATFAWKDCPTGLRDRTEPCYMADYTGRYVGGDDGFGIRFSRAVSRRSHSFVVATSTNCRTWYSNPADADDFGAVYRNQDQFYNPCDTSHYNWHRGAIVYSFLMRPGCPKGEYKIDTKMAHTWSSSGVSSISASANGISIGFTNAEDQWTAVSNPRTWLPCGA